MSKISFKQGLVQAPLNFLVLNNNQVNLVASPTAPVVATLVDGQNNYLINETTSISPAWTGPFTASQN